MQNKTKTADEMSAQDLRKFGITTGVIVIVIFALFFPWVLERNIPHWPWFIAGILFFFALLIPTKLALVYKYWMIFGEKVGWVNSRIILGIIYFLMFVPIGMCMRIFGYDPMASKKKTDSDSTSYRIIRPDPVIDTVAKRMENPY